MAILLSQINMDDISYLRILRILKSKIDWYEFCDFCLRAKILCLVYKNFSKFNINNIIPESIYNSFRYYYLNNRLKNQELLNEFEILEKEFKTNDIHIHAVKGIFLLKEVYNEDIGARILSDLDFISTSKYKILINDIMLLNNYTPLLINDKDKLVAMFQEINSYFYQKKLKGSLDLNIKVDIEFNFLKSYSMLFSNENKAHKIYDNFLYICSFIYENNPNVFNIEKENCTILHKIIDLHEIYIKYDFASRLNEITQYAEEKNLLSEFNLLIEWLNLLY